jgi:hypothetical protein
MDRGRESDARARADARVLDALYGAVADPLGWPGAMAGLAKLFEAAGAAMVFLDSGAPHIGRALGVGAWDDAAVQRYREFAAFDPAPAAFARQPRGTATTTDRMFTPRQIRGGLFFNEFFRPLGLVECAGGVLFRARALLAARHPPLGRPQAL